VRLKRAPAAKGFHHAYLGGLLEHTLSMVRILDFLASHYPTASRDMLIAGGILHDIGKIEEFSYDRAIDYSTPGRLLGHIYLGVEMLDRKIAAIEGFPEGLALELKHVVLAHHGELDFGSPKRPKTVEALIVHFVDDLDAKVIAFREFIGNSGGEESEWTLFHRFFERFLHEEDSIVAGEQWSVGGKTPSFHRSLTRSLMLSSPKIARPIRTRVAPSSTATSKSSVIPMESSRMDTFGMFSERMRSRSARRPAKQGLAFSGSSYQGAMVMSPWMARLGIPAAIVRISPGASSAQRRSSIPRRPG
jgi:putative nucleotidyltransferase with HDIG domain